MSNYKTKNMVQLTTVQRIFAVKTDYETHSFVGTQRLFRIRFPDREAPTKMNIWKNVRKYGEHGTSLNRNEHNSGRRRTGRTVQDINAVQEAIGQNPTGISCRRNGLGLPSACFNRIVRLDLNWHPYRIQITHEKKQEDYADELGFVYGSVVSYATHDF